MDDLNKNQIVLLAILISFVTSIATGIMTVSLLQEAPLEVTKTINNIVEKTIETVTTPGTTVEAPSKKEVTTVVVKEEDQVIDSINKNIKSIVRIRSKDGNIGTQSFYGIGLVVGKDGLIAADRKTIESLDTFTGTFSDGTELSLVPQGVDKQTNFIVFKAVLPEKTADGKAQYIFSPATLSVSQPVLGQTLTALGGQDTNAVAVGRVVSLDMKETTVGTTTSKYLSGIDIDIITKDLVNGSPVFNLSGAVVGMKLSSESSKIFVPVSILNKEMSLLVSSSKTP